MNGKRLKVANDLLIDIWSSGMLDKLLDPDSPSEGSGLQIAKIGYPVWSDEIFSDSKPPLNNSSSSSRGIKLSQGQRVLVTDLNSVVTRQQ